MTAESGIKAGVMELDYVLHTYLGYMAIIALNPDIEVSDLKQIKGIANVLITEIGRNFITEGSDGESAESEAEESSGLAPTPSEGCFVNTAEDTTSPSEGCGE
ncbi:MAG: hypothetical protein LBG82_06575 [Clostridiales Family XIII bacterium]|nr:hypothetical protein [Clostridiales Family XIII bacterium]